jgi:hypothetical protein
MKKLAKLSQQIEGGDRARKKKNLCRLRSGREFLELQLFGIVSTDHGLVLHAHLYLVIPGMVHYTFVLLLASIGCSTGSIDVLRSRFETKMANIIALEARMASSTSAIGMGFPPGLVDILASDKYHAGRVLARFNGAFTPLIKQTGFRLTRDLIGGMYMTVLQDLFLTTQDELLPLYDQRDSTRASFDYAPSVARLMALVTQNDPRRRGVVKSTERVDRVYTLIKTEKNLDKLESEVAALFAESESKRGKSFVAATVRAACAKVKSDMATVHSDLEIIARKLTEKGELLTAIRREKERAIVQYQLGY